jgi:Zn-dependent membrane protease YugP
VYNSRSVAAVGVACHEAGTLPACTGYFPLKIRNLAIPATRFALLSNSACAFRFNFLILNR